MTMKKQPHIVTSVAPDSIAWEMGIAPGDVLLSINDQEINDFIDYRNLLLADNVTLLIRKPDGEEWEIALEDYDGEDPGLEFENPFMDSFRSCANKCIFCFIDQLPAGMRESLYFKDDDSRLSFYYGNYVTFTNMGEADIQRIIRYRLSPVNISVHATEGALRARMLGNRRGREILPVIRRLYEAGITMNGQIVLCKGVNDGAHLERTIRDLSEFLPCFESLSVVPVGLTDHREGLTELEAFTKEDAREVLDTVHRFQGQFFKEWQTHFVHASDEWYILADAPMPPGDSYDGYLQLENGVGMARLLQDEFEEALAPLKPQGVAHTVSVATGVLAFDLMCGLARQFQEKFPNVTIHIYPIKNAFFGERITVSGLITGHDLADQLAGRPLGDRLLLPANMFQRDSEIFLDDMSRKDLEKALQVPVDIVESSGQHLLQAFLRKNRECER